MNARTEGSLLQTDIKSSSQLTAQFARYTNRDALCCASQMSIVNYRIDAPNSKRPLLVPVDVKNSVNPRQ
ncbi:MAG: hypothetical protein JGK34_25320 [Microcoleus sp. PH2017_26_ELK_O_A]|nr:hypothetical protein [Microcoleus sp. PH2017_26_ELK_O_A]MCC3625050.1 hypothetical protein [Microcoleus sp. PH2017_36_ELK_O_B]